MELTAVAAVRDVLPRRAHAGKVVRSGARRRVRGGKVGRRADGRHGRLLGVAARSHAPILRGSTRVRRPFVATVREVDSALYGPGRRTTGGVGWRIALARRRRSHRSAAGAVVGDGEWRPR